MTVIRIGTRGSALALAQSNWVKRQIEASCPDLTVQLSVIKTEGDRFVDASLQAIGGKGLFTKEIEDALLRNEIDLAVHSMKDLPTELPAGLTITAVPEREDPRDVLVSAKNIALRDLPDGAKIGTGSLRRKAQLLHYRQDLAMVPIRGNVDTRLKKLDNGAVGALIMAAAGLKRIGREERITEFISSDICLSAAAQGALALESREHDPVRDQISFMHDRTTFLAVSAERSFLGRLGGGCHVPVGARGSVEGDRLSVLGVVARPDGSAVIRGEISGLVSDATRLGHDLAEQLLRDGAAKILALR